MRSAIIGFLLGALVVALSVMAFQQWVIRVSSGDFDYRFRDYVFSDSKFPWGYLVDGRVINRCLFPVTVTTNFYDAQYNEVTEADKPGRYGAVVKIACLGGVVEHRFITLYRSPGPTYWDDGPAPGYISTRLPSGTGIDPVVLQKQQQELSDSTLNDFYGGGAVSSSVAVILAGLSETSPNDPPAVARTDVESRDANWWFGLRQRLGLIKQYPFLLDLPHGYDADPARKWPLILYLHSGADTGNDLSIVRKTGLAAQIANGRQLPAIVLSPQSPAGQYWNYRVLDLLLDQICAKYRVDTDRISVVGVSMGGDCAWEFALAHPERFAAVVSIAGEGDPADNARLKDVPVWDFQGGQDEIVPTTNPIACVNAIRQFGGHAHLTLFPNASHGESWTLAFNTEALYTWLLAQKRGQPEVSVPGVPAL